MYKWRVFWIFCVTTIIFLWVNYVFHNLPVNFSLQNQSVIAGEKTQKNNLMLKNPNHFQGITPFLSKTIQQTPAEDFPLGWYDNINLPETNIKIAREGSNIVMPYVGNASNEKILAYLNAANTAGIKVILEMPRPMIQSGQIENITQFVRTFKTHPAIFAWYLYDEPELANLSPTHFKPLYDAIKSEDPRRPIALVFARLRDMPKYQEVMDILMFDHYPCNYGEPEFAGFSNQRFRNYLSRAASYAEKEEGFWFVLQAFGEQLDGTPQANRRLPTNTEMRYMFYTSVLSGANGLLFWTHPRTQQFWVESTLNPIVENFHSYIPAIQSRNLAEKVDISESDIQTALYKYPNRNEYLLILVNHQETTLHFKTKIDSEIKINSLIRVDDNNLINFTNGSFEDTLKSYQVSIYQLR